MQNSYKISDRTWTRVIEYVQLAMLSGTPITDYLRNIRVSVNTDEVDLAEGQDDIIKKEIELLTAKVDEIIAHEQNSQNG